MANLYIIAGCNGAGKTTASFTVLPEMLDCREFVNADEIARGLSPFQPEQVAVEAARIMLQRIEELLRKQEDFAIETTLATRSYVHTIKRAREKGYNVTLVYFWLNSPELAIARVKTRVAEGGHNIPEEVIRRRYKKGLQNLFNLFIQICHFWIIIDNSQKPYVLIADGQEDQERNIHNESSWDNLKMLSNE
jgi:predicted ABC-type ATPase